MSMTTWVNIYDYTVGNNNLLTNGNFEIWSAGTSTTYLSNYPLAFTGDYVKATSTYAPTPPQDATNPALSLTGGGYVSNAWLSSNVSTNQRFHIDLGNAKIIKRIYYENFHNSGAATDRGAKNFTLWGSNTAGSFAELTYATDTGWTQIGGALQFDIHASADAVDPKYITVTNTTAYRYYALKIADAWTGDYMGFRRVELQEINWNAPDGWTLAGASATVAREASIIKLGTYSAKLTRAGTDCDLRQIVTTAKGTSYWQGRTITFGCWVYTTVASRARLSITDTSDGTYSSYHTGNSTWQWLSVTHTLTTGDTGKCQCVVDTGNTSAYFDGGVCVEAATLASTISLENFEQTSLTISNLTGDTDIEYKLEARIVNGYNGGPFITLHPNNDTTTTNFGRQYIQGNNVTASADRSSDTKWYIGFHAALGDISTSETIIQAKSGYIRTAISSMAQSIATTTVTGINLHGFTWNNTSDEITSMVILADQTNGLGIGSQITLYKKQVIETSLVPSSEPIIITQGSYSLKGIAAITSSLNKTLTRTISSPIDLTSVNTVLFDIRASRTGSNIKIGLYDATVPTTTEITPNILVADTWQAVSWDISGVTDANKNAISKIIITIINADVENTFYIDNMRVEGSYNLQSFYESTIKTQGSYSLKGIAVITDSLNKTLTRTF